LLATRHRTTGLRLALGETGKQREHPLEVGDLADVASSRTRRTTATEVTLFKSVGLAVEDLVIARLAFARAGL
jgi:ornithine cyclodeaminase/alanine dehydrogenase-like protein (mu-crystallin family)